MTDSDLPVWLRAAGREMDSADLVQTVVHRTAPLFTAYIDDADFRQALTEGVASTVGGLHSVIGWRKSSQALGVEQTVAFAKLSARLQISPSVVQRALHVALCCLWESWSGLLTSKADALALSRDVTMATRDLLTEVIFGYHDVVASRVEEVFLDEYDSLSRSRPIVRRGIIDALVRGHDDVLLDTDPSVLAYDVDLNHVAVTLPTVAEGTAAALAVAMCAATGAQASLVYPTALRSTAVWLGRGDNWTATHLCALGRLLTDAGLSASIGGPASGMAGFRLAFSEANDVDRLREAVTSSDGPSVIYHRDIGLEVLLLNDPDEARSLVLRELGSLAGCNPKATVLRQTLDASINYESHVAAAEYLGVHEHTVRKRLQRTAKLLGRPPLERRIEVQVAMRLLRYLPDLETSCGA